ncbi:MAG: hypothetical protein LBH06_01760 [Rikenellaceae bacterium]|jgi:hypothetical protein|nr:hypothetical protein [Rikenellaceae bacterium]
MPKGCRERSTPAHLRRGDAAIFYKKKTPTTEIPRQVSNNATNIGAWEMFSMEMGLMDKISGLSGAVQSQVSRPGTAASLYAQEAQNSMLNYAVVFDRLTAYCKNRDEMLLKVIMQYYDTRRYVDINGKSFVEEAKFYEPALVKNITDFNLIVTKSNDTPVFRQASDNKLTELMSKGVIPLGIYLNNVSMPGAQKILAEMKSYQQSVRQGQSPQKRLCRQSGTQTVQNSN